MDNTDLKKLQDEFEKRVEDVKKFTNQMNERKKTYKDNILNWTGGIVGAIARAAEEKKMKTFLETPIIDGMTYQELAEHMGVLSTALAEIQKEIQSNVTKDDSIYYGNIRCIDRIMVECHKSWSNIAPTVANNPFKVAKGQPNTLTDYAMECIAQPLRILDWPSDLQ